MTALDGKLADLAGVGTRGRRRSSLGQVIGRVA
jgi:hypothetical protein